MTEVLFFLVDFWLDLETGYANFVKHQPYGSLFNWLQSIGVENKQGMIGVDEALEVVKKLQLKSLFNKLI